MTVVNQQQQELRSWTVPGSNPHLSALLATVRPVAADTRKKNQTGQIMMHLVIWALCSMS